MIEKIYLSSAVRCVIFILLPSLFLSSCGALFGNSNQLVRFNSEPAGAKVLDNGSLIGKTPTESNLTVKKDHYIEFRLDGYETVTRLISPSPQALWIVLDILAGFIGIIIDAATGSWNGIDTQLLNVELPKK